MKPHPIEVNQLAFTIAKAEQLRLRAVQQSAVAFPDGALCELRNADLHTAAGTVPMRIVVTVRGRSHDGSQVSVCAPHWKVARFVHYSRLTRIPG